MVTAAGKSGSALAAGRAPGRGVRRDAVFGRLPARALETRGGVFLAARSRGNRAALSQARKVLHDNGVAYNLYSDAENPLRAWELNPLPLCLAAAEWAAIAKAVGQRARLINGVLNDLYGPQTLLAKGLIPEALVYGNNAFLRPCHGVEVPGGARLIIYSADLARSPDGRWWSLSDGHRHPREWGMRSRIAWCCPRVFPEIFRTARIVRLGGFFESVKKGLRQLSPRGGSPNVVMLTPGPFSETYFEHAYLSRQLGSMLVQGQDLTVRDDRVYIKTLQGLQQVDVILRRVDEEFCDPIELRDDSLLGVPGLLGAIRAGTVVLANALGSGLVQSPALGAFWPGLCREVLGEELMIPSVATWWCGEKAPRQYVLDNLPALSLREAFGSYGPALAPSREAVIERPEYFAAQELVQLSKAPHFHNGQINPGSVILRVFAVRCGDDYHVMPGGLTRVTDGSSSLGLLLQQVGGSKDTWIERAEDGEDTAPQTENFRVSSELTSRIADNLFWLGRYAGRGEFTARLVRASLESLSEEQGWRGAADIAPFAATLRELGQIEGPTKSPEQLEHALVHETRAAGRAGNLRANLQKLRDIAATARDHVTDDAWRILNRLADSLAPTPLLSINEAASQLNEIVMHFSAFNGVFSENMTHGIGWRFVDLGRNLERAISCARVLAEVVADSDAGDAARFEILLELFDATISYRQKYPAVKAEAVLELLLCEEANPRSLAALLASVLDDLEKLPREGESPFHLPEERGCPSSAERSPPDRGGRHEASRAQTPRGARRGGAGDDRLLGFAHEEALHASANLVGGTWGRHRTAAGRMIFDVFHWTEYRYSSR